MEINCDNLPVVEVLNSGKAGDSTLVICARNTWVLSAMYNIHLNVQHIDGSKNIADLLSRWQHTDQIFQKLYK